MDDDDEIKQRLVLGRLSENVRREIETIRAYGHAV
jgi:hypothetical protein